MGTENSFLKGFFKKAGMMRWATNPIKRFKAYKREKGMYPKVYGKKAFDKDKVKKDRTQKWIGRGLLAASAGGYGASKLQTDPEGEYFKRRQE